MVPLLCPRGRLFQEFRRLPCRRLPRLLLRCRLVLVFPVLLYLRRLPVLPCPRKCPVLPRRLLQLLALLYLPWHLLLRLLTAQYRFVLPVWVALLPLAED